MLVCGETCECWVPGGQVCECCMFANQPEGRGTHEAGKGAWDPGRGTRQTEGLCQYSRPANMCVLVNLESVVCVPALANICLYQLKRSKEI